MYVLIIAIIGSIFTGCANLDVASKALQKGDFNTSYRIYAEWAKRGEPKSLYKVSKFAQENFIKKSPSFIIKNALKAYKKGFDKAANILFIEYYKLGKISKAKGWFLKVVLAEESLKFYRSYLSFIQYHLPLNEQLQFIKKLEQYALKTDYPTALQAMGEFYEKSIYISYQKSEEFYSLAYKYGNLDAGIALGLLYIYKMNQFQKGYELLKEIATKDNGQAAYMIARYRLKKMDEWLQQYNRPPITFDFETPIEFFTKKIKLEKMRDLYLKKVVGYWLLISYKKGYIPAKIEMIAIDNRYNNFGKHASISGLTLKKAIALLETLRPFRAKMVLAKIYEEHPELKKIDIAKQIYTQYIQINKDDAYWHLYQLYKKYFPENKKKFFYLNYLVAKNFEPALIEKAYWDLLEKKDIDKNVKLLQFYAKRGDITALTYLASIYSKNIYRSKKVACQILRRLSNLVDPLDAKLDLKITECFAPQEIVRKATIYKYYADKNDTYAVYQLFKIYNTFHECNKELKFLKKAIKNGSKTAELAYAKLAVSQYLTMKDIDPINILNYYAKRGNIDAIISLADAYYTGIIIEQNIPYALRLYNKAYKMGSDKAIYKLINIYLSLDEVSLEKFVQIKQLFHQIKNRDYFWKITYANFLFKYKKTKLLKKFIFQSGLDRYSDGKYLLYKITGKKRYISQSPKNMYSNPHYLLLYAKEIEKKSKKRALYYAYIASFLGSRGSGVYILKLLKFFSNPHTIEKIYQKAKRKAQQLLKQRGSEYIIRLP